MRRDSRRSSRRRSGRGAGRRRALLWVVGIAAVAALVYGGRMAYSLWQFEHVVYKPLPTPRAVAQATPAATIAGPATAQESPTPDVLRTLPAGRINILVMGTDKRANDPEHYARSDTMVIANLEVVDLAVAVMSVPRDLVVNIPGYGKNKINAAYLFGEYYKEPGGGAGLAVQSISQFFNVPIDYYATVNFDGFRKLIDTVGGVDIDVPYAMDDYNYPSDDQGDLYGILHVHFDAGLQHMDGKTALRYVRTRHADNDFMRSKRQLQVILATRRAAMRLNLVPALPSLVDQLAGMVQTNIPFDKQVALTQLGYQIQASNIITSAIDSELISATTLPDGSEGLKLNWAKAQPMLDDFFGASAAGGANGGGPSSADTATPVSAPAGAQPRSPGKASLPASSSPTRTPAAPGSP